MFKICSRCFLYKRFSSEVFNFSKQPNGFLPSVCRTFLSDAYISKKDAENIMKSSPEDPEMALQTLSLNRCHERDMPVSALMLDRMMRAVNNDQHLSGSLYYFYKFRHSLNGYYLQPWTTFTFVIKCLKMDANILLKALQEKVQYGVFPQSFLLNLALDHFLNNKDIKGAVAAVSEMFLLETLDSKVSQALALHTVSEYWNENLKDDQLIPEFENVVLKRNISAVIFTVGVNMSNTSLIILGSSLLGSIENEHGIRAVFQDPWGPLSAESGYLKQAITCLLNANAAVSQESVDVLLHFAATNEELNDEAQSVAETLKHRNLISNSSESTLQGIAHCVMEKLPEYEKEEQETINNEMKTWKADRNLLEEIEEEIKSEIKKAREIHFRESEIEKKAHQMAVETLGFWDLAESQDKTNESSESKPVYYLREDYVEGAMEDLDIVERFRKRRNLVNDSVVLVPQI